VTSRIATFGFRSGCAVEALARRHDLTVVQRCASLPLDRPDADFDDVLLDGELLGRIGEGRPDWLDDVDRIFVLPCDESDPIAPLVGPLSRRLKRAVDVMVGLAALVVCLPVIAVCGAWVKLDSRGPIFYRQVRVGMDGRKFEMWKLRTMRRDCDDGHHRQYVKALMLLSGEMSLVGPRPNALHETAWYDAQAWQRLRVKPGVTGPWQVEARGLVPFGEMVRMDIDYIEGWSVWRDIHVLMCTPAAVFGRAGAA
jgi:lipopolysaccharide/colanic/teichoic acid biosynthesis glycosyltransferase